MYRGIEMRENSVFCYRGRSCTILVVLYTPRNCISNDIIMVCKESAAFVVPKGKMLGLTPSYNFLLGRNKFKGKSYILNTSQDLLMEKDLFQLVSESTKHYVEVLKSVQNLK